MQSISTIIMAAGQGTRMKSATPKVLHKICGKSMLFLIINEALKISDDVHIVLYHEMERVKNCIIAELESAKLDTSRLVFHKQNHEKYPGTGGAIMGVQTRHPRILVLNGDMPLIQAQSLQKMCEQLDEASTKIAMSVFFLNNPSGYGRVIFDKQNGEISESKVIKIVEQKDATPDELQTKSVNAGVYVFDAQILQKYLPKLSNANAQGEYYLTDIIALAVADSESVQGVFVSPTEFMGVNTKIHLAQAQNHLLKRLCERAMEQGARMDLPSTIYLDFDAQILGECVIENGVRIEGASVIENSHIKANSVIESSLIVDSDVGPNAHIRPKCEIKGTHIGNFVECKNAKLNGVKAGHLSYLGDCEIGAGSNIGAGTITCNYDGKLKHKTLIGENVFIGSDTQLVAPVSIESNTIIAAGSTITKDVKSGELAISRKKQKNVSGFFDRFFGKK